MVIPEPDLSQVLFLNFLCVEGFIPVHTMNVIPEMLCFNHQLLTFLKRFLITKEEKISDGRIH